MGGMSTPSPSDLPNPEYLRPLGMEPQKALPLTAGSVEKPHPLVSITASAAHLTGKTVKGSSFRKSTGADWQADGWEMYDLIGEQRFIANVLAGRAAQARLFVGKLSSTDPLAEPEGVDDPVLQGILDAFGKSAPGRAQIINRAYINYFVPGEVFLVGIPPHLISKAIGEEDPVPPPLDGQIDMMSLDWRALSISELKFKTEDEIELYLAEANGRKLETTLDEVYVIRSWRSHPERAWHADSPTRSSLPVLRELVGLTMAIGGQTDSRLAGAGMLVVPDSARKAMLRALDLPETSGEDPFTDALIEAMSTAISDRSNAAAFVPLVVTVPDESADKFQHITFSSPFDKEMRPLREEAIRRLALGQDAPPELLLGTGGMNHWGAWLVREDVVTTHIEPPLGLFCDSLTTQYLRPMMLALGYSQEEVDDTVVWYDVSHMIVRPNRSAEAKDLYDAGELSGEAYRNAAGFDENDAPPGDTTDPAVALGLDMIAKAPSLMQNPGLESVVAQIRTVLAGETPTDPDAPVVEEVAPAEAEATDGAESDAPADGIPQTDDADPTPPEITASAADVRKHRAHGDLGKAFTGQEDPDVEDEEAAE
ncbi:portal protein [Microbacterium phage FuzzBuster]|uniref:Portal protein n=1 Tax=Microbacterium phage FuzzBuster TaxID=2590935 RepID=A0A516KUZ7_9CAUD|nr:portal protein [Microbacterium phage FuzzBuster]